MKPASHWLVPDKETSLVNHLQQIRLNPSEIILPVIWNICWVRLSWVHSPLSMQWQSLLSTCTWFYPIQHTQLGCSSIINACIAMRWMFLENCWYHLFGKALCPLKRLGSAMGASAPGLRYGTSKPTNSCRAPIKGAMTPGGRKIWTLLLRLGWNFVQNPCLISSWDQASCYKHIWVSFCTVGRKQSWASVWPNLMR